MSRRIRISNIYVIYMFQPGNFHSTGKQYGYAMGSYGSYMMGTEYFSLSSRLYLPHQKAVGLVPLVLLITICRQLGITSKLMNPGTSRQLSSGKCLPVNGFKILG